MARNEDLDRIEALAAAGRQLGGSPDRAPYFPEALDAPIAGWRAQVMVCIEDLTGGDSPYYQRFVEDTQLNDQLGVRRGVAILDALSADVADGYLGRRADLIAAEVFTDFLDMADHLIKAGYVHPAASLIGAVLEDGMRRIARNHKVTVQPSDDLSALNTKCLQGGVYSTIEAGRVAVWTRIRNAADHGDFDAVRADDVQGMHKDVARFLGEHLT